jgi:hypothetical protein
VDDPVDVRQGAIGELCIADIADNQLNRIGQIRLYAAVNLLLEGIQDNNIIAAIDELADEMRTNKSSAASD